MWYFTRDHNVSKMKFFESELDEKLKRSVLHKYQDLFDNQSNRQDVGFKPAPPTQSGQMLLSSPRSGEPDV